MVKFNVKKFVAVVMATSLIAGSSMTAFATPGTGDGAGTYEGDDVGFGVATSLTVPTTPTTGFAYIADPNGLIAESGSAHYANATWAKTAKGLFFKTSEDNGKAVYSEKSAALSVLNNNAAPIVVSAKIKQKDAGTAVFTDDATFGLGADGTGTASTDKSVYIAVTNGTDTKAIKAGGAEVELSIPVVGKVGNYALTYADGAYSYALKSGIALDDNKKWNSTSVYVTGFLNENADWTGGASVTFPTLTVTWDVAAAAAPIKIRNGKSAEGTLTHKADTTIAKVLAGTEEIGTDIVGRTNPTASAAGKLTFTAATSTSIYSAIKAMNDGLLLTVEYADGTTEPVVIFAK